MNHELSDGRQCVRLRPLHATIAESAGRTSRRATIARRGFVPVWSLAWIATLGACESRNGIETVHPTPQNLPADAHATVLVPDSLPTGLASTALLDWIKARNRFVDSRAELHLGELSTDGGEGPEVFGFIWDVEMDAAGNIYVLDTDYREIRVFDSTGRHVESFGSSGDGPEQFRAPRHMDLLDDGRLVVSDRGNQLKVFAKTPEGYRHSGTVRASVTPDDLCSVGDRIFVSGWRSDGNVVVHEVATQPQGSDRGFGNGYQADNELVRGQMSDGLVACTSHPDRVLFGFSLLPIVRAYDADRRDLLWTAQVQDYAQMGITELRYPNERSAVRFSHKGIVENLVLMHGISSKHVLMQTGRGTRPGPDEAPVDPQIRTYLVDAATGNGALVSDSLPLIMAADSTRHVAVWFTPYPQLEVRTSKR